MQKRELLTIGSIISGCLLGFAISAAVSAKEISADGMQSLTYHGTERSYVIRVPNTIGNNKKRVPLVLVLHGGGGNAQNIEKVTGFTDKANQEGFIVVYPEGTGRRQHKRLTWNAGHCCGHAMQTHADDVGFIDALISKLIANYPIDLQRIYATGMSNGGMMTHRLGRELSQRFAAIAPVVGTVFGDEKKSAQPVSAIMLNGMLDKSVPHEGGPPGGHFTDAWDGTPTKPALDQLSYWANANGCTMGPNKNSQGSFTRWQYTCPAGRDVVLYLIDDNGHSWPGGKKGSIFGDKPSASFHGTDIIWDFFQRHMRLE